MKQFFCIIILFICTLAANGQTLSANGTYLESTPDGATVSTIYVFKSLAGASITYTTTPGDPIPIYKYRNSQSDEVPVQGSDIDSIGTSSYTIKNLEDGYGYLFKDSKLEYPKSVWVFNYSQHLPVINSIDVVASEFSCDVVDLQIDKSDVMTYYGRLGQARTIERRYDITYQTMKWDETNKKFEEYTADSYTNKVIGTNYQVEPPLIDTEFTISGDQFGKTFEMPTTLSSATYTAVATEGHITSEQEYRKSSNEVDVSTSGLGGAAPARINFYGNANEPTTRFYTWFIYNTSDLKNYLVRYTDQDIKYDFNVWGTYRVVLETTDLSNTCTSRDSVEFKITESMLDVPNFFSPGDSPGMNDEFRVAYKSLVTFKCTIFNRWGTKLYEFRDPAKGWDGRYKGSLVNPGVYFYVIEARGADGEVYKKKGDINIVRSK